MKISDNFFGIKISAAGLSVQRKKMNLIAENIANTSTTKTKDGTPYQRKFLVVKEEALNSAANALDPGQATLQMNTTESGHIPFTPAQNTPEGKSSVAGISSEMKQDKTEGENIYMPEHPDADSEGYVQMPNVNIVTEMVDMIAATRSYESNLTALNSSKQMAKDSLEI